MTQESPLQANHPQGASSGAHTWKLKFELERVFDLVLESLSSRVGLIARIGNRGRGRQPTPTMELGLGLGDRTRLTFNLVAPSSQFLDRSLPNNQSFRERSTMRVTIPTTLVPYQFRLTKFVAFGSDVAGLVGWTI